MKKIYIASDHAGFNLKKFVVTKFSKKLKLEDLGTHNSKKSVNYPDYAHKLCKKVSKKTNNIGILICGSGIGISIAANRFPHIRAALCNDVLSCELARLHNDANILVLGARLISKNLAIECINKFLSTNFEGGRHKNRVKKLSNPPIL